MNRHITLAARADNRRNVSRWAVAFDIVNIEPVKIAYECAARAKGQIRISEVQVVCPRSPRWLSAGPFVFPVNLVERSFFFTGTLGRCWEAGRGCGIEESFRLGKARNQVEMPRDCSRIAQAGLEARTWIG